MNESKLHDSVCYSWFVGVKILEWISSREAEMMSIIRIASEVQII